MLSVRLKTKRADLITFIREVGNLLRLPRVTYFVIAASLLFLPTTLQVYGIVSAEAVPNPSVDEIVRPIVTSHGAMVSDLISGDIDVIGGMVTIDYESQLDSAENVATQRQLGNTYTQVLINCEKYPLNITALRRAIAYALDKNNIVDTCLDGRAEPQDTVIPQEFPLSIESDLSETYYSASMGKAQDLLTEAGFADYDEDGFLDAPDHSSFHLEVLVPGAYCEGTPFETAMDALQINSTVVTDVDVLGSYIGEIAYGNYDLALLGSYFLETSPESLIQHFYSEYIDPEASFLNMVRFANDTFDSLCDDLLQALSWEDIVSIFADMQSLLWYECPVIVLYQRYKLTAYRTDTFAGFRHDPLFGAGSWWTFMNAHLISGSGGTISSNYIDSSYSFNPMDHPERVLTQLLWDTLLVQGIENSIVPNLAESWTITTHSDDATIPSGHMRVAFEIYEGSGCSDGSSINAHDVAYSLNYHKSTGSILNPYYIEEMVSAVAETDYTLVVEFSTEFFWHVVDIGLSPIFSDGSLEGISWSSWNPNPPYEELVTTGPFNVTARSSESFTLSRNPHYRRPGTITTTTTTTDTGTGDVPDGTLQYALIAGVGAAVVVIVAVGVMRTRR